MPKWKVFLTMEFEAEIEADEEREAVNKLDKKIEYALRFFRNDWSSENPTIKRWWGGANEIKKTD